MKKLRFSLVLLTISAMLLSMALSGCSGASKDDGDDVSWNVGSTTSAVENSGEPTDPANPDNPGTDVSGNSVNPNDPTSSNSGSGNSGSGNSGSGNSGSGNSGSGNAGSGNSGSGNGGSNKPGHNPDTSTPGGPDYSKPVTYYVDSVSGNSSNNGLSEKTPVKRLADVPHSKLAPGSKVLLKAGSTFKEQLSLTKSGKAGAPIVYDMYGKGAKPIIDGQGKMATVEILGVQYLEMRNLQICSSRGGNVNKRGIWVRSNGVAGALNHLYFQDLDIHNMKYNGISGVNRSSAGIYMDNEGEANKPNYYNDVRIERCHIYDVSSCGIIFNSMYGRRKETPTWNLQPLPYTPATNVVIRNNIIHDLPGDGIWLSTSKDAKIEYNTVYKTGDGTNTAYAGMWPHNSDGCVMQYNEAYGNYLGGGDGQGLDVDINCNNTIVQYNYSHDNEGGFLLVCTDGVSENYNRGTIVRYNISQNDLSALFSIKGIEITGLKVYNNTFYTNKGYDSDTINCLLWSNRNDAEFKNNIFVNESSMSEGKKGKLRFVSNKNGNGNPIENAIVKMSFENNVFAGKSPVRAPKAEYKITVGSSNKNGVDPGLVNPGAGKIGRRSADCYKLKSSSICRGAGVAIPNNGGKDFFGNKVSGKTSIGAHQG